MRQTNESMPSIPAPTASSVQYAFRHTPRRDNGEFKYIPLNELPEGTEIRITTIDATVPSEEDPDKEVNGLPETSLIKPVSGSYTLKTSLGSRMTFEGKGSSVSVRRLYNALAAGSHFTANLDGQNEGSEAIHNEEWATTYRLFTGMITKIEVPVINLTLQYDPNDEAYLPASDRIYRKQRNKLTNSRGL